MYLLDGVVNVERMFPKCTFISSLLHNDSQFTCIFQMLDSHQCHLPNTDIREPPRQDTTRWFSSLTCFVSYSCFCENSSAQKSLEFVQNTKNTKFMRKFNSLLATTSHVHVCIPLYVCELNPIRLTHGGTIIYLYFDPSNSNRIPYSTYIYCDL